MKRNDYCGKYGSLKIVRQSGVSRCHPCTSRWNREYYQRSAKRRLNQRRSYIQRTYGVSLKYLEEVLADQGGRCAICRKHWKDCKAAKHSRHDNVFLQHLYVDHDHDTGRVRGLLCNNCNCTIAFLEEDVDRIQYVEAYLRKHKGTDA